MQGLRGVTFWRQIIFHTVDYCNNHSGFLKTILAPAVTEGATERAVESGSVRFCTSMVGWRAPRAESTCK